MNERLHAALKYRQRGWSVIPVGSNKRPCIDWEEFQTRIAGEDEMRHWWEKMPTANVGIVTGAVSNLTVIDMDTEEGEQEVYSRLPEECAAPQVKTPRGRHYYFQYDPRIQTRAGLLPGCDARSEGGMVVAPPSKNNKKCWTWVNEYVEESDLIPVPESLVQALINPRQTYGNTSSSKIELDFNQGMRNQSLFRAANFLARGNMPEAEIELVLKILGENCTPPLVGTELNNAIKSAISRQEARTLNLASDIRKWVEENRGYFRTPQVASELDIVSQKDRANLRMILSRLAQEGTIERVDDQVGAFRIPNTEAPYIDFMNVSDDEILLTWPLDIQHVYKCLPKTLTVIAGEVNMGKTAFLLNFCELNMGGKYKINYFCSEMGPEELRDRMQNFKRKMEFWNDRKVFAALERRDDFHQVIGPNDINIIDYMEIDGSDRREFWRVGGMLADILAKLNKGIAIVAIQKNKKNKNATHSLGLGGYRGMEKPRLYFSLTEDKGGWWAKVEKCKHPKGANVQGKWKKFNIVDGGSRFVPESDWCWR